MRTMLLRSLPITALVWLCSAAQAALMTENSVNLGAAYGTGGYIWYRPVSQPTWNDATPNLLDYSDSFNVINNSGNAAVTTFRAEAGALSGYTQLSTWARISVDNPMTLGTVNQPYADEDENLIPGGMPTGYSTWAMALLEDKVTVSTVSGAPVASLRFELAYDGVLSGKDQEGWSNRWQHGSVQIDQYNPTWNNLAYESYNGDFNAATWEWHYSEKAVNTRLMSFATPVKDGKAIFAFAMTARAGFAFYDDIIDGGSYEVSADFGSTLHLAKVHAYDAAGNELALQSVLGESGTAYAVSAVPEPSRWLLLLGGLCAIGWLARRDARGPRLHATSWGCR